MINKSDKLVKIIYNDFGRLLVEHLDPIEMHGTGFKSVFIYNKRHENGDIKAKWGYGRTIGDSLLNIIAKADDDNLTEWILDKVI